MIHGHGGDESLVADGGAVLQLDSPVVGIHLDNLALLTEASLLLGDGVCDGNPDAASTSAGREAEGCVGAPVTSGLLKDDIAGDGLDIRSSNTLTEPSTLHLNAGGLASSPFGPGERIQTLVVGTAQTL